MMMNSSSMPMAMDVTRIGMPMAVMTVDAAQHQRLAGA
jgi:hypothetical protein